MERLLKWKKNQLGPPRLIGDTRCCEVHSIIRSPESKELTYHMLEAMDANEQVTNDIEQLTADVPPEEAPTRSTETFWNRLDSVLQHLEHPIEPTKALVSAVFQPKRISLNSQDDTNITVSNEGAATLPSLNTYQYNNFTITLQRPVLNAKSIQLLRATIPTPITNIPDSETVFWYYRLPTKFTAVFYDLTGAVFNLTYLNYTLKQDGTVVNSVNVTVWTYDLASALAGNVTNVYDYPTHTLIGTMLPTVTTDQRSINTLCFVRLLPSFWSPSFYNSVYGFQLGYNRTFQSYQDLATELNKAAAYDPILGLAHPDPPNYYQNDVQFGYDATYNKMTFTGLTTSDNYYYIPVSYTDVAIQSCNYRTTIKDIQYSAFTVTYTVGSTNQLLIGFQITVTGAGNFNVTNAPITGLTATTITVLKSVISPGIPVGVITAYNPVLDNFNRYAAPNQGRTMSNPLKLYRPLELRMGWTYNGYDRLPLLFNQTLANVAQQANSYCDLVNSQDVYVYIDFIGGGTLDSAGNGGLLSVIPLNTVNNGVAFYNNVQNNPITHLPEHLGEIKITLLTDTGDAFNLPNNAITNLELGFSY